LQTTLLGLAIAIILALVAALVGPLVVDWSSYRSTFEAEASHLIGLDMRVTGAIDARLLPSPRLTLRDVEFGKGADKVAARSLGIEFALGPLLRGEWHASDLHVTGAAVRLGLDAAGRLKAPNIPIGFAPDALSIDRLSVEDSRLTLSDAANGGEIVLDKFRFNGEARSLIGPVSGEGAATIGGELYPFRVSTGRANDDGAIKLHLNVDPLTRPLNIEADGMLAFAGSAPTFDGTLSIARPVGIASPRASSVTQPWRVSGKLKVTSASALMPQAEFQYGSEEQGFKLTGTAEFKFDARPRFDGVLSGRQIDVDRALADSGQQQPAIVLRNLAGLAIAAFRPSIPIQLGVGIDRVTLGGATIENVRGDVSSNAGGWSLDRFEFRAPGFTQVRLSGELATDAAGASFKGPAELDAGDPKAFAAWLEGRAAPEQGELRPLHLRGDVAFSGEQLSVARLTAEFDRKSVTGNILYAFAGTRPARFEADLAAQELDIDALLAFGKALAAGSDFERPRDIALNATIGRARYAGLDARDTVVRVKADAGGLQIDRLSVGDLGGNSFAASGRIDTSAATPHGSLAADLDIKRMPALAALVGQFWPFTALPPAGILDRVGRAKLHATLDVSGDKETSARLTLAGDLDAMKLDASLRADGDWTAPSTARLQAAAALNSPDGNALLRLAGLDRLVADDKGPGTLKLDLAGVANGALAGSWRLTAAGLDLTSQLALDGNRVALSDLEAKFRGSAIHGRLTLDGQTPRRIEGALDADSVDAAALLAAAVGMPAPATGKDGGWTMPGGPFAGGVIGDLTGAVALKAQRVTVGPQLAITGFSARMQFLSDAVTFDTISGDLAGGRYRGRLGVRKSDNGVSAVLHSSLNGANAAALLKGSPRPPVTGLVDVDGDVEGSGFSIAALVGSLHGTAKIVLNAGELAGLDPRAFDSTTRAVDQGMAVDAAHVVAAVNQAFDGGHFPVKRADAVVVVSNGQARLNELRLNANNMELLAGGTLDLANGAFDGRLTLLGLGQTSRERPYIVVGLKGPLGAPERTVDASGLTAWLTLRSVENESRRLKAMERTTQPAPATTSPPPPRKTKEAPARPAPLEIKPLPLPRQVPEASVGPQ